LFGSEFSNDRFEYLTRALW